MKNCPKCRSQITDDDAKICPYCGANIEFVRPQTKYDTFEKGRRQTLTENAKAQSLKSEATVRFKEPYNSESSDVEGIAGKNPPSELLVFVGILFPLFGFILYSALKSKNPSIAKNVLKGAQIGTVFFFILLGMLECTFNIM